MRKKNIFNKRKKPTLKTIKTIKYLNFKFIFLIFKQEENKKWLLRKTLPATSSLCQGMGSSFDKQS